VTLQIRDTVNGYPGQKILPFSEKTLNPDDVINKYRWYNSNYIYFSSPVYLQENTEYAFV
jgi:hypothetical protein